MFGGTKPTFGQAPANTGFGFNSTTTASPFGQSTFGKPATGGFGQAPAFGQQQNTSLFGGAQNPNPGLFGASTSTAFGATTTAQPSFGGFSQQPQQNTSIFGAAQPAAPQTSLFGQPSTSAFGAAKPSGFGFGQTATQPTTSLFGQAQPTSTAGFGSFGQAAQPTNAFASTATAFGQPTASAGNATGSVLVKYQPTIGTDTLMKGGTPNNVNTKQHCITAMKEYEAKSLEELRFEDYLANRKGPQAGTSTGFGGFGAAQTTANSGGLFGASTQQTTGLFGQQQPAQQPTENKNLFGTSIFGQPAPAFGGAAQANNSFLAKPFSTPATSTTGFAFGSTQPDNSANNPFGAKPAFGQTQAPSLFGQPATQNTAAPAFGQTNTAGFGGFGASAQQTSVFGATATDNKPSFGLAASTANTGFGGFGTNVNTSTAGGGLFGQKPAPAFGNTSAFGATAPTTGFSNFQNNQAGSLFNSSLNKQPTTGFGGFGTQTSTAPLTFNTGQPSLFGNTANKPLFGNTLQTGNTTGGLFGGGQSMFGNNNTMSAFGTSTLGGNTSLGAGQQQNSIPIHQHILSKVTSPYGDNPIFKDLKRNDETDALRATNPVAQKAILESTGSQFKISAKPSSNSIKIKPVGSALTKKALFEGLEEFDSSVETFSLKPNAKRLVIKPKPSTPNTSLSGVSGTPQSAKPSVIAPSSATSSNANQRNNESFSGEIPQENIPPSNKDADTSRRESWLHPNNLEKVRQQNVHHKADAVLNNTLTELVPRKSSELPFGTTEEAGNVSRKDSSLSKTVSYNETVSESYISNRSYTEDRNDDSVYLSSEPHPTGIVLRRVGYYTIPSLDDLKSYLAEDGSCVVPNFTIGREGYGNVYFNKEMDVAGLNLDEIVHFRNKEVIIYPDDDNKPPIGSGLNREAQITLDQVWPHDKTKHEPIKDPQRLAEMDYELRLRRVCDKNDIRFIEYRPETGSWVFKVKHFSKYGINDSDEEDDIPTDPKKAKMNIKEGDPGAFKNGKSGENQVGAAGGVVAVGGKQDPKSAAMNFDEAEFMLMDKTQFLQNSVQSDFSYFDTSKRNNLTSPTAILANGNGTDSHKLQLMKASLFIDDDMDSKSVMSEKNDERDNMDMSVRNRLFLTHDHDQYSSSQSLWKDGYANSVASSQVDYENSQFYETMSNKPREAESITPTVEPIAPVVKYQPLILKPKVAQVKGHASQVPFENSLAFRLQGKCAADLGIFNSRKFKVCFGPQNNLIIPATKNSAVKKIKDASLENLGEIFSGRKCNDFSQTVLYRLKISSAHHIENFEKSIVDHLEIQLKNSLQVEIENSDCPMIKANGGTKLIVKHLDEAMKLLNLGPLEEYAVSVWSLCLALWGEQEELEDSDATSHHAVMWRRNLLSQWLENTLTDKDLLTKSVSKNKYIDHLMDLIMCHKVVEGCELAFKYDDANLSLLLAQLSSGPVVRQLMEDQLAAWHKVEADKFISVERLKLFMLVAGVSLMDSSHGPINSLEGIEWIKVLALQLWYLCSPTCSITDALLAYEKAFKADEFYALPPSPHYTESIGDSETHPLYDLRYHIFQLYSKRSHPLESLLNPLTHTADFMDFRLNWLLLQTFEALGYHHCSEMFENQMHVDFASQLENYGLWKWSVFVLLHIKEQTVRESHIENYLYRYASVSNDGVITDDEKFIINVLGVPEKWLDWAKAVKAGATGNYHMQAKYLLKAQKWAEAHEVIFEHIAPDAVINDNMDYLHDLLSHFDNLTSNKSIKVPNWSNQGQIFLDFIDINEKFKSLKNLHEGDIEARWENLKPQLADLCSRINLLPCPTPKHRLCQSEIAQSLACLVRGVLVVCPSLNPCLTIKIALERLPLPQEFAQQELRALLDALVIDLCNSKD
ncbi:nuclear pore complex protein Nup98-Nup96 [Eupeodes corollae]|uniref:nuclear pore complex protein Nup98-Nup96 n=1 Tax=Eupeodes corollae TaxID=290404 RepID=UPI00248F8778|nr:nuclear pore complex protein Nup98-Nup96 [Eupeodes corollae]